MKVDDPNTKTMAARRRGLGGMSFAAGGAERVLAQ
jgi:hypothetical protein